METRSTPIEIQTVTFNRDQMTIQYPQVINLYNQELQHKINQTIIQLTQYLIHQQKVQQQSTQFFEMIGSYEIKTNERNILSLSLSNYAYVAQHANGLTIMKSLTFNTQTGQLFNLADLFKVNSNYIERLSQIVNKQITERDIPLLQPFVKIDANQDFYIADKSLVLYFQPIEITPHYFGFPMFPISVFALEDIMNPNGPLQIVATNN